MPDYIPPLNVTNALLAAACFSISILVDIVWGLYIRRTADGQAFQAAVAAAGIMVLGAANILGYTRHPWLLVPIVIGSALGTYTIVRWDHRKQTVAKAAA